jgi:hypothetical protein
MIIQDNWDDKIKDQYHNNKANTVRGLITEFGELDGECKINRFIELGPKPFSIIAFHNRFFAQARTAYIMGAYYPALTAACALGERILNHLILTLRDDFKMSPQYKQIYRKDSFDDWTLAIDALLAWDVLLPKTVGNFRSLMRKRHESLHFCPETDHNDGPLALSAIKCLQEIIGEQFSGFGPQPWFITGIPGEIYIKKDWINKPFIKKMYLPNGHLVGPRHRIESIIPTLKIIDAEDYESRETMSDDEFIQIRKTFNANGQRG